MKVLIPLVAQAIRDDATLSAYVKRVEEHPGGLLLPEETYPACVVSPATETGAEHSIDEDIVDHAIIVYGYLDEQRPKEALLGATDRKGLLDLAEDLKVLFLRNQLGLTNPQVATPRVEYPQIGQSTYPDLYEVRVHLSYKELD